MATTVHNEIDTSDIIDRRWEELPVDGATLPLRVARPRPPARPRGIVLMIPHKHGADDHTRQLADGLAGHGMVVATADLLARLGGTQRLRAGTHPTARGIPGRWHLDDLRTATDRLTSLAGGFPLTVLGEAFGCDLAVRAAREDPRLRSVVTIYGPHTFEDVPRRAAVLSVYAQDRCQRQRAERARRELSDLSDATVVSVAETHRPFLDVGRPKSFDLAALEDVLRLVAGWISGRSVRHRVG